MHARIGLILAAAMGLYGTAIAPALALDARTCTADAKQSVMAQAESRTLDTKCATNAEPTVLGGGSLGAPGGGSNSDCRASCFRSFESCRDSSKNSKGSESCNGSLQRCLNGCNGGKSSG